MITGYLEHRILLPIRSRSFATSEVTQVGYGVGGTMNGREIWHVYVTLPGGSKLLSTGLTAGAARWLATLLRDRIQKDAGTEVSLISDKD